MTAPTILIGFPAAGKTTVGRAVAHALGRRFVDLDDAIAAALPAGETVAALVARDEPAFRRREAAALAAELATAGDGCVIATGGGAATFADNLARMRAAGLVVALDVAVEVALVRARAAQAAGAAPRPTLAHAEQLARARAAAYRGAHALIDTTHRTIEAVVGEVLGLVHARAAQPATGDATWVVLGARRYPIVITDELSPAVVHPALARASRIAVISDRDVAAAWRAPALAALATAAPGVAIDVLEIAPGEASKSFAEYERLTSTVIALGCDRSSVIVALGGGVVGDLAGFVAATALRGMPIVQLPTSLVAMVDSAIGGKTAIDLPAGKNLVGAFWQPKLVHAALATLATLPARERIAGFGELWKYAVLDGAAMWDAVAACASWATAGGALPPALHVAIARAVAYKAAIVGRDEREQTGVRALLNLGHTVGHAIETASGMLHGEAVALGLLAAARVSRTLGGPARLERELAAVMQGCGLPTDLDRHLGDDVVARIGVDKKRRGDALGFVVVREVGHCEQVDLSLPELRRILLAPALP